MFCSYSNWTYVFVLYTSTMLFCLGLDLRNIMMRYIKSVYRFFLKKVELSYLYVTKQEKKIKFFFLNFVRKIKWIFIILLSINFSQFYDFLLWVLLFQCIINIIRLPILLLKKWFGACLFFYLWLEILLRNVTYYSNVSVIDLILKFEWDNC